MATWEEALKDSIPFKQAKQGLISILDDQASQYVKQYSSQDHWDKLKEAFDKGKAQELTKIIDQDKAQKLTGHFMERLKQFEEKLFAYPLTNENLKSYGHELANVHLQSFSFFLALELNQPLQTLSAEAMRKNYQEFNTLLAGYYMMGVDARLFSGMAFIAKKMISSTQSLFDQQIKTAKFKDATLSHFVDLKPIVESLKN